MPHNRPVKGRPARVALVILPLAVVGLPRDRSPGSFATNFVRVPAVVGARDLPARHHHADHGARRLDDRAVRDRAPHPRHPRRHPGRRAQRARRHRGQELLPARRRRRAAHLLGAGRQHAAGRLRAGRLDADAAARARDLPLAAQDALAQGQRGARLLRDRAALLEGPDPDDVRQRDLPRPRQLRRRGRVPLLLRQERQGRHARRGGAARGHRPAAGGPVAVPQPGARAGAARDRAAPDAGRAGYITEAERRAAEAEPLPAAPSLPESIVGPYFCEEIRQYLEKTYGEKDLYRRGLRVESTLDPEIQPGPRRRSAGACARSRAATASTGRATCSSRATGRSRRTWTRRGRTSTVEEGAVAPRRRHEGRRLRRRGADREADAAAAERRRRVDGRDRRREDPQARRPRHRHRPEGQGRRARRWRSTRSRASRAPSSSSRTRAARSARWSAARTGRSRSSTARRRPLRQAGSAFKPFVYLTALEQGYTGADTVFDGPLAIIDRPAPAALPPEQLRRQVPRHRDLPQGARALVQHPDDPRGADGRPRAASSRPRTAWASARTSTPYPSLALGAFEVSLLEMTSAYTVFANQGLAFTPYLIERVTDSNGDVLEQTHPDPREVESPAGRLPAPPDPARRHAARHGGPRRRARRPEAEHRRQDRDDERLHRRVVHRHDAPLHGRRLGRQRSEDADDRQGRRRRAHVALPIWIRILEKMRDHGRIDPQEDFDVPPNIVFTPVDYETGLKATADTPVPVLEAFVSGSQPTEEWTLAVAGDREASPGRSSSPSTSRRRASCRRTPRSRPSLPRRPRAEAPRDVLAPANTCPAASAGREGPRPTTTGAPLAWTSTVSVATTSRCRRTWTVWAPTRRIGSASSMRRRSTSIVLRGQRVGDLRCGDRPVELAFLAGLLRDRDREALDLRRGLGRRRAFSREHLLVVLLLLLGEPAHVGVGRLVGEAPGEEVSCARSRA